MGDVTVRTADPADAPTLVSIKRDAIEGLTGDAYTADQKTAWAPDEAATAEFRAALDADSFQVLVAEADDTVVGYGVLNAEAATIDALFVRPFWTRDGIATRLLSHLEMSAAVFGCDSLSAVVALNAVPFYEQSGYERAESRIRTIGGIDLEFLSMSKELDDEGDT